MKLTAGDYSTELDATSAEADFSLSPTWNEAATHAARRIETWIRRNREKLAQKCASEVVASKE